LNFIPFSKFNLFESPLKDKDLLKRVILFSDSPLEDPIYQG
jgi:hypothetical protein